MGATREIISTWAFQMHFQSPKIPECKIPCTETFITGSCISDSASSKTNSMEKKEGTQRGHARRNCAVQGREFAASSAGMSRGGDSRTHSDFPGKLLVSPRKTYNETLEAAYSGTHGIPVVRALSKTHAEVRGLG